MQYGQRRRRIAPEPQNHWHTEPDAAGTNEAGPNTPPEMAHCPQPSRAWSAGMASQVLAMASHVFAYRANDEQKVGGTRGSREEETQPVNVVERICSAALTS